MNHQFSPTIGLLSKEEGRVNEIEFFPKRRICIRFGKNSTAVMYRDERD